MRQIVCHSCGKRYDYEKGNFCPKCGSYNQPERNASTRLEQDQLSRFGGGSASAPPAGETPPPGPAAEPWAVYRETPPAGTPRKVRIIDAKPPTTGKRIGFSLITLLIIVFSALSAVPFHTLRSRPAPTSAPFSTSRPNLFTAPAKPVETGGTYGLGETFPLNETEVSVDDLWWVSAAGEGERCLAVEVWITGGSRQDHLRIEDPALVLADGSSCAPLDDSSRSRKLAEQAGLYVVNLRDYQWEDPLYGQLVFYLPEEAAGAAELIFPVYAPGDKDAAQPLGSQTVRLTLPE